jgi:hypothetical protein
MKRETSPNYSRNRTPQQCVQNSDKDPNIRLIPEIDVCLSDIQICAQKNLISQQVARNLVGRGQHSGSRRGNYMPCSAITPQLQAVPWLRGYSLASHFKDTNPGYSIWDLWQKSGTRACFPPGTWVFRNQFYLCSILIHH